MEESVRVMRAKKGKLFIADPSTAVIDGILTAKEAVSYHFETAKTGPETLKKLPTFLPDLILIDLMLPQIHGIEILKRLKANPRYSKTGLIVSSYSTMIQNYRAAIEEGALYFLAKPFDPSFFFQLVTQFFNHQLKPTPFSLKRGQKKSSIYCYSPSSSTVSSYLRFWGTRGSTPVSGAPYVRYGGNTSCLEIRDGKDLAIFDAGTGIRELGEALKIEKSQTFHLFISHTHWDHITGFPFFAPLYQKECDIVIWAPVGFNKNTKKLFTRMLAYAYFPVRLDELRARVRFKELRDKRPVYVGSLKIDCHFTNHPGPTVGFKITSRTKTIGYVTDNEVLAGYHGHPNAIHLKHPLLQPHLDLIEFLKGCDRIIHEAQYLPKEYIDKMGWGHSSISNATVLLKHTDCREWIVTHHDPSHTDQDLECKLQLHKQILKECEVEVKMLMAYDHLTLPLS